MLITMITVANEKDSKFLKLSYGLFMDHISKCKDDMVYLIIYSASVKICPKENSILKIVYNGIY